MLSNVSLSCFAFSYAIALFLELTRHAFKIKYRIVLVIAMTLAGLAAHVLYLFRLAGEQAAVEGSRAVLSSWYDWSLLASFGVALVYFAFLIRKSESMLGTFLLPVVMLLIGLGHLAKNQPPFNRETANSVWLTIHGVSLLLGTMLLSLGFAVALMFLVQAWRLKRRKFSRWLRLPSLEYLEKIGVWSLYLSAGCVLIGLVSGVVINLQQTGTVAWTEGGVLFSICVAGWLAFASVMQISRQGPENGRLTAWLNVGSFLVFLIALILVIGTPHGRSTEIPDGLPTVLPTNPQTPNQGVQ